MKIPKIELNDKTKKELLKALLLLIGVIFIFACLSRWLTRDGKTLAQLSREQNGSSPGNTISGNTISDNTSSQDTILDNTTSDNAISNDTISGNTIVENTTSDESEILKTELLGNGDKMITNRITYEQDFYFEPISNDLLVKMTGISYPENGCEEITIDDLRYIHILYYDFNKEIHEGELVCNQLIANDLVEIFYNLYTAEYQLEHVRLIDYYNGDDTASMTDNNSSCFNYRNIPGQKTLSNHALGLAIDINPFYNPYITYPKEGGQHISPPGSEIYADRSQNFPYKIDTNDYCYRLFIEHGFTWGGNWNDSKDYQHFQKVNK